MRNFFAKYELVWIIPLSLIVALLSVMGLGFMQQQKLQEQSGSFKVPGMVQIQLVTGYANPDGMNQTFCRSREIVDNYGSAENEHRSTNVVYDGWYRPGAFVSPDTVCTKASQAFVDQAIQQGFRWQGSGVGD